MIRNNNLARQPSGLPDNGAALMRSGSGTSEGTASVETLLRDLEDWVYQAPTDYRRDYTTAATGIKKCLLEQHIELNLYDLNLSSLPKALGHLTHLRRLYLGRNPLHHLPTEIGQLTNLTHLVASNTALASVPETIGNLQQLQVLDLSFNWLRSLPEGITQLRQLEYLYLHPNPFYGIPAQLAGLPAACTVILGPSGDHPPTRRNISLHTFPDQPDGPVVILT